MARQRKHPVTNHLLAVRLEEAGWSMSTAARRINQTAEENGRCLRYRAPSVSHWLTGVQPNPKAVPIIVEAFARALDRPDLTAEDLGWPGVVTALEVDPWAEDLMSCLSRLGRSDLLDPDGSRFDGVYRTAYLSPRRLPQCRTRPEPKHLTRHTDSPDVARLREGTTFLLGTYETYGGGYARALGSCFLVNNTLPVLRGGVGADRDELLSAASELACLLGTMCNDAGIRAGGQRYHILALRLAAEAADPVSLAIVYSRLAAQAALAGQMRTAFALLDAAESNNQPLRYPMNTVRAFVHAFLGQAKEARAALAAAERELSLMGSPSRSHWFVALEPSRFAYVTGLVLMALGDLEGAATHLSESLRTHRPGQRLRRALTGVRLARVHVSAGRPVAAAECLRLVADDMNMVVSAQLTAEIGALRDRWPQADRLVPAAATTARPAHQRNLIVASGTRPIGIREHESIPVGAVANGP